MAQWGILMLGITFADIDYWLIWATGICYHKQCLLSRPDSSKLYLLTLDTPSRSLNSLYLGRNPQCLISASFAPIVFWNCHLEGISPFFSSSARVSTVWTLGAIIFHVMIFLDPHLFQNKCRHPLLPQGNYPFKRYMAAINKLVLDYYNIHMSANTLCGTVRESSTGLVHTGCYYSPRQD